MPAPETNGRDQDVVLWRATGRSDRYGRPVVGEPEEIEARWVGRRRRGANANGEPIILDATLVYFEAIPLGSNAWLGTLEGWYGTGSAGDSTEVHEVVTSDETPDVKARETCFQFGLMRHKDGQGPGA